MPTDLELLGLAERPISIAGRSLVLTIDFEAFAPGEIEAWIAAMRRWAALSQQFGLRSTIFIAVEDIVRLRSSSESEYERLLGAARELFEAGAEFHPHNHGVYDPASGQLAAVRPQKVAGYRKRASFAYDVVHRHGRDVSSWLETVVSGYRDFIADAAIARPHRLAFRAGGWDHGDTSDLVHAYVRALEANGFDVDSSASSGEFGTKSWRVGAPFGSNTFALSERLIEIAPCWAFDCGEPLATRSGAAAAARLLRQPKLWLERSASGAFVTVLHFDHLFRDPASPDVVEGRVDRFFRIFSVLRRALGVESTTFDGLVIAS